MTIPHNFGKNLLSRLPSIICQVSFHPTKEECLDTKKLVHIYSAEINELPASTYKLLVVAFCKTIVLLVFNSPKTL